jgi:DNA-binding response OmpR family regulator
MIERLLSREAMIRVLAIDGDPLIRKAIKCALTRPTYALSLAESGSIGVERYQRGLHELVITDLLTRGPEGALTIIELRVLAPSLPILVISGDGRIFRRDQLLESAREFGATATLPKPFTAEELRAAVVQSLRLRSMIGDIESDLTCAAKPRFSVRTL